MSSPPFDTQKMTDRLESVGIPADQAKMQVAVLADAIEAEDASITERFAGKPDVLEELSAIKLGELNAIKIELEKTNSRITETRIELEKKMTELKSELMRWVVTVVVATGILQTALISALILKVVH